MNNEIRHVYSADEMVAAAEAMPDGGTIVIHGGDWPITLPTRDPARGTLYITSAPNVQELADALSRLWEDAAPDTQREEGAMVRPLMRCLREAYVVTGEDAATIQLPALLIPLGRWEAPDA